MKILFINSLGTDYVQDLTYFGLVRTLGFGRVVDFPWNKKYHVPYKKYPQNLGYTGLLGGVRPPLRVRDFRSFDLVIVASSKVDAFQKYLEIVNLLAANTKVVFLDGGDQPTIGGDLAVYGEPGLFLAALARRPFDFIFKREFLVNGNYGSRVFPFPMCFGRPQKTGFEKDFKYDVTFWAVESDDIRSKVFELLQNQFDCSENGSVGKQRFSKYKRRGGFYLQELKRSKVALNFRGGGWDTLRYWEIPASGGPLMISQELGILIPSNYRHGVEVVFCNSDLSDLIDLASFYLRNESLRAKMVSNALKWTAEHHTPKKRVEYFFKCIGVNSIR